MGAWSKAAVEKELDHYLDAVLFVFGFEPTDVLRAASDKIGDVIKGLEDLVSSNKSSSVVVKDDVINECRLKVENELQYICDNINVSHNQPFKDFLVRFKSKKSQDHHLYDTAGKGGGGTSKKIGKVPPQLTLQQQKDDEKKLSVCVEKQDTVKQLTWDYHKTLRFMESFLHTNEEETILIDAHRNITNAYCDLYSNYGYGEVDKWYHLDVSLMIKDYKSKMENELNQICNKVSNPTIKQAFSRHLTDVVTAQNHHRLHLHNKDEKTMSSKQKMSVKQKKKKKKKRSGGLMRRPPELISVKEDIPSYIEDHSKCCFKIHEMDQMLADLMKSPPKEEEEYTEEYHPEEEFELDLDLVECYDIE